MKSFFNLVALYILIILSFFSCSGPNTQSSKITINLSEFTEDGLREKPIGVFMAINYEFCIPADEKILAEVQSIDSTADVLKGSKGRSGCTDKEWLCIGSSNRPGFKIVIRKLAGLIYIRKINETFWE